MCEKSKQFFLFTLLASKGSHVAISDKFKEAGVETAKFLECIFVPELSFVS